MRHLLSIQQLNQQDVIRLVERAISFKTTEVFPQYSNYPLATLFYENSTRTRISFELAARKLGFPTVNFDIQSSSESKGEVIDDTFQTLIAMGIKLFVIRHQENGLPALMAKRYGDSISVVNAGDGQQAHPTQALLDFMTIIEKKPLFNQLKVAIVGDLRHSRVANSFQEMCALMGVGDLVLVAPPIWQSEHVHYGRVTASLKDGLDDADVVMCLRVQNERLKETEYFDLGLYRQHYALTQQSLAYAKPDVMVMHPGPMNRGVEIDSDIADGPQSVILQQVQNGVYMRMAILDKLCSVFFEN
jgi:aspartate carbamoyltransferase catalytic subunit